MKLAWKGNQRYNEDISKATIRKISSPIAMSIHKYVGCGDNLYFSCNEFGFIRTDLCTEDWDEAEKKALNMLKNKCDELIKKVDELIK